MLVVLGVFTAMQSHIHFWELWLLHLFLLFIICRWWAVNDPGSIYSPILESDDNFASQLISPVSVSLFLFCCQCGWQASTHRRRLFHSCIHWPTPRFNFSITFEKIYVDFCLIKLRYWNSDCNPLKLNPRYYLKLEPVKSYACSR